jgi:hypothetical protein
MSTRERWIVYPLLFLTLGIAIRDKFLPPRILRVQNLLAYEAIAAPIMQSGNIKSNLCECRDFTVFDPSGRPVVKAAAGSNPEGGIFGTFSPDGKALIKLVATEAGGAILTFGHSGQFSVVSPLGGHPVDRWGPPAKPEKSNPPDQKQDQ